MKLYVYTTSGTISLTHIQYSMFALNIQIYVGDIRLGLQNSASQISQLNIEAGQECCLLGFHREWNYLTINCKVNRDFPLTTGSVHIWAAGTKHFHLDNCLTIGV